LGRAKEGKGNALENVYGLVLERGNLEKRKNFQANNMGREREPAQWRLGTDGGNNHRRTRRIRLLEASIRG